MSDKQAAAKSDEVVVEGYGVRGKDFLEIWQSPASPEEQVRVRTDQFAQFRSGLLATKTDEQDAIISQASRQGKYLRSDPDIRKPFVCRVNGCMNRLWFSADAFTRHTEFAHTGLFRK